MKVKLRTSDNQLPVGELDLELGKPLPAILIVRDEDFSLSAPQCAYYRFKSKLMKPGGEEIEHVTYVEEMPYTARINSRR